jgi:hypothetical protein
MAKKDKKAPAKDTSKAAKGGKSKSISVDFSTEEAGGGGAWIKRVPEGVFFPFTIQSIKAEESSNGNDMLTMTFKGNEGKVRNKQTRDRFVLLPTTLFKLRQLLEAVGETVPKKKINVPHDKLIGKQVGISFLDDEYNDKITSKPDEYCPVEECDHDSAAKSSSDSGGKKSKGKKGKKGKDSLEDLDLENI